MKHLDKLLMYSKYTLYGIMICLFLIFIFITLTLCKTNPNFTLQDGSNLGQFVAGIVGTLISIFALIYLQKTYTTQQQQLDDSKKQFERQQIENVVFNMLQMIHQIGNGLSKSGNENDDDFFVCFMNEFRKVYVSPTKENSEKDINAEKALVTRSILFEINPKLLSESVIKENFSQILNEWRKRSKKNELIYIGKLYEYVFRKHNYQLSHYFRYIHNLMIYIQECNSNEKNRYMKLIQAQLSNYQLLVMFYNALSDLSRDSKGQTRFRNMLDEYQVFQNLDTRMLLIAQHRTYYPLTKFKR